MHERLNAAFLALLTGFAIIALLLALGGCDAFFPAVKLPSI